MKKRLVSGLLVVCMLLSMTACKKDDDKGSDVVASSDTYATYDYFNELLGRDKTPANTVEYKFEDFIELGEYEGVKAEVDFGIKEVTDEEFETALKEVIASYAKTEQIKTGKVAEGDSINLDFEGLLDGKAFENGTATNYAYTIGGGFIEDLDRGLIGLEVGKEYSLPCTFPETYQEETLAGKDVVFVVTVNYINKTTYPEVTDAMAKEIAEKNELTDRFTTAEGLKKNLRESLEEQAKNDFNDAKFEAAWENVLKNCKFTGNPQVDYQAAYDSVESNAKSQFETFSAYGYTWAEFLKLYGFEGEDDFAKYCEESATEYIQTKLAIMAIAKKEGFTVTEEEYKECAQAYVDNYEFESLDELLEAVGDAKNVFIEERYYEVIYGKVFDHIVEKCKEVEKVEEDKDEDKETSTEKESESSTEKATESSTEKSTEASTEASTEQATEASTEATTAK